MVQSNTDVTLLTTIMHARDTYLLYGENERAEVAECLTDMIAYLYGIGYGMKQVRVFGMIIGAKPVPATNTELLDILSQL